MNILLIIPENTGTIASVSFNLYKSLVKHPNLKVCVACLGPYRNSGFQFENVYKLYRNNLAGKIVARVFTLRKIKHNFAIDLSISTLLGATYWNVLSGIGEKKVGVFHTCLSQQRKKGWAIYWINYILDKLLCSRLDRMIAVNKSAYLDLKHLHRHSANIDLAYNIHDFAKINDFSTESISDKDEREIFKNPVILYVGGLFHNIKGTDRLIKAFAETKARHNSCNLVFIGADQDESLPFLKHICHSLNVEKQVYFLGRKNNPYKYMKRSEILVSPSRDEGLPGVLIEALSLGLRCVATNSSMGVWEIMQCEDKYDANLNHLVDTRFGIICPNDLENENFTISQLAKAIDRCLQKEYFSLEEFDKSRFEEDTITLHYVS